MQKGRLLVRTYISNMLIPIKNTRITVTQNNGNGEEILAFRLTDENGKTDIIEIDTPDIGLSLDQTNTTTPFTSVNIRVEKEGFVIFVIENVQIFSDRLSEQNVEMIPLPEKAEYDEFNNVFIVTPQNL